MVARECSSYYFFFSAKVFAAREGSLTRSSLPPLERGLENPMSRRSQRPGVKRVYEPSEASDGTRVLVDRIWPRGLTKEHASIDVWLKDVAPSAGLRT